MSMIAGILNISDAERAFVANVGHQLVFDAVSQALATYNAELALMASAFIERETEKHQFRYLLAGGGRLQRMGQQAAPGAVKRYGYYDVAFPLREWGAEHAGTRVGMAYMTIAELDAHLKTIMIQDRNTMIWRILIAIMEDTNLTFTDPVEGSLTIRRLANSDSSGPGATATLYPPVLGSTTEANDNHYIDAGYAVNAIAAGSEPHLTLRNEIAEHFGGIGPVGKNFVYFHGSDQTAYLAAIAGYVPLTDRYIQAGEDTATIPNFPNVPGRIHGRAAGVWLSEWAYMVDKWGLEVLLDVPAPIIKRNDPADTGLPKGLTLVATDVQFPMLRATYIHRYGLGCGNRLSAAAIYINGANGGYSPMTGYTE